MTSEAPSSLNEAIRVSMAASLRAPDGVAPPAALLWPDGDRQWKPLVSLLMEATPALHALGDYAPAVRRGPVIWLKCVVERALPNAAPADSAVPVLYLPGVSGQALRDAEMCDPALQPLVELQYRGAVWRQRNGRDWTVEAFLTSGDGLGLDMARDAATRAAMLRALPLLAVEPVSTLRGRRLEAGDFDRLSVGDPVRDLLTWMSSAAAFEADRGSSRWAAFREVCMRDFSFDPDADGVRVAADRLTGGGERWDEAWRRYCEAPLLYPGIPSLLRVARPKDLLAMIDPSRWPSLNDEREDRLRKELEVVAGLPHAEACDRIESLEEEHKERRGWVWAQIGESPHAHALKPLGRLARAAGRPLGGASAEALIADYVAGGWRCDRAALDALSCLGHGADQALVATVVRTLYQPWLDAGARRFQDLLSGGDANPGNLASGIEADPEACILFADGLRFDLAAMLRDRLEERGIASRLSHRIAPLPTVTATAKPLASPVHADCAGAADPETFSPAVRGEEKPADAARLRGLMAGRGMTILEPGEARLAINPGAGAWTETGRIDSLGHSLGVGLVRQIDDEISAILERIEGLLAAGWRRIRVVTDHGWLLLPGSLPRVDLPPSVVESKWARCAAVRGGSAPDVPTWPWYWDPLSRIAAPPGIGAFRAGVEYAHGGVSLQECVVPDLIAERREATVAARVTSVSWRGMRCRIAVDANAPGLRVDLRLNRRQAGSSIAAAVKTLSDGGGAGLVVSDDSHEGAAALVVVLDEAGRVLDDRPTTVGGDG